MNADEELRRLLTSAAESYEPPADGATRVLQNVTTQRSTKRGRGMSYRRRLQLAGASLAAVGLLTGVGFAIAGSHRSGSSTSSSGASAATSDSAPKSGGLAYGSQAPTPANDGTSSGGEGGSSSVPKQSPRVVQNGQISLEVKTGQVQPVLDRLGSIATGAGGYLADTKSSSGSDTPYGSSTLRVPAANFTSVVTQVRRIGHVESISSQAQDVTAQYVDLGARISALMQTRSTYLTIQSKATTVGDALAVQQQIQTVQTQIEQLQGQQKVLADSSDLATLAVSVSEAGTAPVSASHQDSGFAKAWHQAVSGFTTGLKAMIRIAGPLLLVLIILAGVGFGGRYGYRRIRRWQA